MTNARGAGLAAILCLATAPAWADGPAAVELGVEPGRWDVRTALLYDTTSKSLVRREVRVWNQHPSRHLVFVFAPATGNRFSGGAASGSGRLSWRPEPAPSYDPSAIVIAYEGSLADGRPSGVGIEHHADGLVYEGYWTNGRPNGLGHLRTGNGADYKGSFRDGKAEGVGAFTDIDGETFRGSFRNGLRDGIAKTTLPNNVTYQSTWRGGVEVASSRKLRLAQLSGGGKVPEQDIRIGITVLGHPKGQGGGFGYKGESQGRLLKIVPEKKGFMELWKGQGTIRHRSYDEAASDEVGMFGIPTSGLIPVRLKLNVVNSGGEPIQVVGALVKVESSALDQQPAVQLSGTAERQCETGGRSFTFQLENYGLGAVRNPVLRFAFTGQGTGVTPRFDRTKSLGTFQKVKDVDLESDLSSAGVDTAALRRMERLPCRARDRRACMRELRNGPLFGRLSRDLFVLDDILVMIQAKGALEYDWQDDASTVRHRKSPIVVPLVLGFLPSTQECGEGGEDVPVADNPLDLKLAGKNYRLPIKFRDSVPPGRTARYNFSLRAAKSSDHRLSIVVQLADGRQVESRPIDITYFVPVPPQ